MLLIFVVTFGLASFAWLGAQFYWAGTCGLSIAIVAITLICIVCFYTFALLPMCNVNKFRKEANIFTVTLVTIYISYLTWSAMASNYDDDCQTNMNDSTNTVL